MCEIGSTCDSHLKDHKLTYRNGSSQSKLVNRSVETDHCASFQNVKLIKLQALYKSCVP